MAAQPVTAPLVVLVALVALVAPSGLTVATVATHTLAPAAAARLAQSWDLEAVAAMAPTVCPLAVGVVVGVVMDATVPLRLVASLAHRSVSLEGLLGPLLMAIIPISIL